MNGCFHFATDVSQTPWRRAASAALSSPLSTPTTTRVLKSTERAGGLAIAPPSRDHQAGRAPRSAPHPPLTDIAQTVTRRSDPIIHTAFLTLGCAAVCWRYLTAF